uniref:Uncharacterized protein n=1 Tax=Ixodes ricinus TaxID=34613 RepID=A0A6B0UXI0_IXORI
MPLSRKPKGLATMTWVFWTSAPPETMCVGRKGAHSSGRTRRALPRRSCTLWVWSGAWPSTLRRNSGRRSCWARTTATIFPARRAMGRGQRCWRCATGPRAPRGRTHSSGSTSPTRACRFNTKLLRGSRASSERSLPTKLSPTGKNSTSRRRVPAATSTG